MLKTFQKYNMFGELKITENTKAEHTRSDSSAPLTAEPTPITATPPTDNVAATLTSMEPVAASEKTAPKAEEEEKAIAEQKAKLWQVRFHACLFPLSVAFLTSIAQ